MRFNKKQLEIIATALALSVEEMTNEKTQAMTETMLGNMQSIGVYGDAEFWEEE
tara:strand:+ start:7458 stop:7619 length:162 start_codon:yes stop_codon:yes gene_type:complete